MWAARTTCARPSVAAAAAASTSARGGRGGGGGGGGRGGSGRSALSTGRGAGARTGKPGPGNKPAARPRPPAPPSRPASASAPPPKKKAPTTMTRSPSAASTADPTKEAHKLFDEVILRVRAGAGGRGEVSKKGGGRTVKNFKYAPGGRKGGREVFLAASPPADGAPGGDVVVMADPALGSLLHLHGGPAERAAPDGQAGNPARGSAGPRPTGSIGSVAARAPPRPPALILRVPPGTVVRRGPGGPVIGEVVAPGQRLVVARGGAGGPGVVGNVGGSLGGGGAPSSSASSSRRRRGGSRFVFDEDDDAGLVPDDAGGPLDPAGAPGEAVALHLLLRVVADVGLVGAPNAGKSSLLAALTAARPEVGAHPFTTLMPNLGVLSAAVAAGGREQGEGGGSLLDQEEVTRRELGLTGSPPPVLADLPGLIPGAHAGRGLGRAFLRHARRAAALLHVLDGTGADPGGDYRGIRRELALYNPAYAARPHVVAFNKADMLGGEEGVAGAVEAFRAALEEGEEEGEAPTTALRTRPPLAIIPTSAVAGTGLAALAAALEEALRVAKVWEAEEADRGAVGWDVK